MVQAPTRLAVSSDRRTLSVDFPDGSSFSIPTEMLRVMSPSAEVQGHSPEQRKTVAGKQNVEIIRISPVGNYAVRIHFDDMHSSGIFTWAYLYELGQDRETKWQAYLEELSEKGLSR